MQTWKRFVFWTDELVTQPESEPASSSPTPPRSSDTAKKSSAARRELSNSRKKEAHKGIQALQITCGVGGIGFLVFGGADGRLTVSDSQFRLLSTRAYTKRVTHLSAVPQHGIIISVGDGLDPRPYNERQVSSRISRLVRSHDKFKQYEPEDPKTVYHARDHSASIDDDPNPRAIVKI